MKQKLKNLWNYFTTYEKIWFISITVLAFVFAIIFPEEDFGGVNGKVIMALYLLDIFLNITCELLISKQSKWNFIVSLGVEITEILICVVLSYRFATMATTLFFWIPIDIISFINWNRHKDREQEELTEVRRLTGKQEVLVLTGIVLWTVVVGYFLTTLEIEGLVYLRPAGGCHQYHLRPVGAAGAQGGLPHQYHLRLHQVDAVHQGPPQTACGTGTGPGR